MVRFAEIFGREGGGRWISLASILGLFFILSGTCAATEWSLLGPDTLDVLCYEDMPEAMGTTQGLGLPGSEGWELYSNGSAEWRITDIAELAEDSLIVTMGFDLPSFSDGIWLFEPSTDTWTILQYTATPACIESMIDTAGNRIWFAGSVDGILRSYDGINWEILETFMDITVSAMTHIDQTLIISTTGDLNGVIVTDDYADEFHVAVGVITATDYTTAGSGTVLAVSPGTGENAGIYASNDNGYNWSQVYATEGLSAVEAVFGSPRRIAMSWDGSVEGQVGVGVWDMLSDDFVMITGDLPTGSVHNLGYNDFIDCENVIACTDQGAYMTCDFPELSVSEERAQPSEFDVAAYPNPFNSTLRVTVNLQSASRIAVSVYDLLGREMIQEQRALQAPGNLTFAIVVENWATGVYFVKVTAGNRSFLRKVALIR